MSKALFERMLQCAAIIGSRSPNNRAVEILCISCAAFAVCVAIFFLPRAAAFVDNRTSSVTPAKVL